MSEVGINNISYEKTNGDVMKSLIFNAYNKDQTETRKNY